MVYSINHALTIAGSDSSGGAGIQADLKTFSALGVYGASVITALTAQNTCCINSIHILKSSFVTAQIDAVFNDIQIDAVKIGMLANSSIIRAVADALRRFKPKFTVLDTVILSKSNHKLLASDAVSTLYDELLPLANIITPNLQEAAALLNDTIAMTEDDMVLQGQELVRRGAQAVLIKGGHLRNSQTSPDWLINSKCEIRFDGPRIHLNTYGKHGTGCTLSSAIAALLPRYQDIENAVRTAKIYLTNTIAKSNSLNIGHGIGPVHHFHMWW
ncbi:MAG: bifunctional hydroxymethylpyrimidine kinase/phosphomethylpyrimidine kinase [Burkholderia sp.]|nr:bifunctional hydroxymethylpyrimidine kinase/phosphomethylpyrimidine kinase [Burkholderia sp.]